LLCGSRYAAGGIRDAICGHSPRTVADKYEKLTLDDIAEALKRYPQYDVAFGDKGVSDQG
jgi:hypothetical protein